MGYVSTLHDFIKMEIKVNIPPQVNGLVLEGRTSDESYQYLDIKLHLDSYNKCWETSYTLQDITHISFGLNVCCKMSDGDLIGDWEYENHEKYILHMDVDDEEFDSLIV